MFQADQPDFWLLYYARHERICVRARFENSAAVYTVGLTFRPTVRGRRPFPAASATDRKGKVESGIGHTQKTPLLGLRFETLDQAQVYLGRWEAHWADTRIHGTTKVSSMPSAPFHPRAEPSPSTQEFG